MTSVSVDMLISCQMFRSSAASSFYYIFVELLSGLIPVSRLMSQVFLYRLESFKLINLGNALINLTY